MSEEETMINNLSFDLDDITESDDGRPLARGRKRWYMMLLYGASDLHLKATGIAWSMRLLRCGVSRCCLPVGALTSPCLFLFLDVKYPAFPFVWVSPATGALIQTCLDISERHLCFTGLPIQNS